jgi:hypothetical protein
MGFKNTMNAYTYMYKAAAMQTMHGLIANIHTYYIERGSKIVTFWVGIGDAVPVILEVTQRVIGITVCRPVDTKIIFLSYDPKLDRTSQLEKLQIWVVHGYVWQLNNLCKQASSSYHNINQPTNTPDFCWCYSLLMYTCLLVKDSWTKAVKRVEQRKNYSFLFKTEPNHCQQIHIDFTFQHLMYASKRSLGLRPVFNNMVCPPHPPTDELGPQGWNQGWNLSPRGNEHSLLFRRIERRTVNFTPRITSPLALGDKIHPWGDNFVKVCP